MLVANHNFDREETGRVFHVNSGVLLLRTTVLSSTMKTSNKYHDEQNCRQNLCTQSLDKCEHHNYSPREAPLPVEMGMRSWKAIDVILILSSELAAGFV
jgi:hypothetical protein